MIKKIIFITIITFITIIKGVPASAAERASTSVTVFPSIISLSLAPGTTSSTVLTIGNNSDTVLPIRLAFEPLTLADDTSTLPSIGSWISFSKSSLLIPAKKQEKIIIKIALPKTIALGGYYGMVYLEPILAVSPSSHSDIVTKMGVLILGSIGVQDVPLNSIELKKPQLNSFISESKTRTLSYQVKNNALNHISAKPYLIIHPFMGKVETVRFDEHLVFPGKKRNWESSFTVSDGKKLYYTADLFVSIGNGFSQKESFSFIVFPIQQAIVLVFCIAGGVSIAIKRKQIKKALQIIMRG